MVRPPHHYLHSRFCRLTATSVVALGLAILAVNLLDLQIFSFGPQEWLGAQPSVGPLFVVLGAALLRLQRHWRSSGSEDLKSRPDSLLVGLWGAVALAGLWQMIVVWSGKGLGLPFWDRPGEELSLVVGVGAFGTGCLVLVSLFYVWSRIIVAWVSVGLLIGAAILLLGYWYGLPFFYGGAIAPVGLITICGVAIVGAFLVSSHGAGAWPLSLFSGSSMRARLMRLFLPLAVLLLAANDMIGHTARKLGAFHPAILDVSLLLSGLLVTGVAVGALASRLGREIDEAHLRQRVAEEKLRALNARLEERVAERTDELRSANFGLTKALTQMRQVEQELVELTAREHARIGRDLHDSVGQVLTGIGFLSKGLEETLAGGGRVNVEAIAQIRSLAIMALAEVRQINAGFYPSEITNRGLLFALQELSATISRTFGVECSFFPGEGAEEIPATMAIHLYRIAQEAISNAIRHGHAREIAVSLSYNAAGGELAIWNNGERFDLNSTETGAGIDGMAERAHAIGGELMLQPTDGTGVEVTCSFPFSLPNREHETAIQ